MTCTSPSSGRRFKWVFSDPERLQARQNPSDCSLRKRRSNSQAWRNGSAHADHHAQVVAHFINRLVLLHVCRGCRPAPQPRCSTRMLEHAVEQSCGVCGHWRKTCSGRCRAGGRVGFEHVEWFNGGLFDTDEALPLEQARGRAWSLKAARLDWSDIDPSIFGTLFERGLDPDKRSQLGAHYTDRDKIMMLIEPVIIRPLQAEWEAVKAQIAQQMAEPTTARAASTQNPGLECGPSFHNRFLDTAEAGACARSRLRLRQLSLSRHSWLSRTWSTEANLDAEAVRARAAVSFRSARSVSMGIEINPYAAELARVTVWIGEIQWMRRNGFDVARKPILRPLDTIECRDAVLNPDGNEADMAGGGIYRRKPTLPWREADAFGIRR